MSETDSTGTPLDKVIERFDRDYKAQQEAAAKAATESAAAAPAEAARAEQPSAPQTYVVEAGDSLSSISAKVYGDAKHWDTIYEHNKDKIKDPDVIHPGQELIIP